MRLLSLDGRQGFGNKSLRLKCAHGLARGGVVVPFVSPVKGGPDGAANLGELFVVGEVQARDGASSAPPPSSPARRPTPVSGRFVA